MRNEMILILSLLFTYGTVLVLFQLLREQGLYLWTIIATIAANIEVLIVIQAFGMEMTLGNILFASTFLVTDIASETCGRQTAQKTVLLGILTSILFVIVSQSWMLYQPADTDWAAPAIREVFSNTPRMMLTSLLVYAFVQTLDVWLYHKWWDFTSRHFGDSRRFLWLRNNGSTLVSQLANAVLFTCGAFWGIHDGSTLISIAVSSYVIFIVTSLADTPFVYAARKLQRQNNSQDASSAKGTASAR